MADTEQLEAWVAENKRILEAGTVKAHLQVAQRWLLQPKDISVCYYAADVHTNARIHTDIALVLALQKLTTTLEDQAV